MYAEQKNVITHNSYYINFIHFPDKKLKMVKKKKTRRDCENGHQYESELIFAPRAFC